MPNTVVIGASGDVGRGITRVLIEHGHRVAAVARDAARLQQLVHQVQHPAQLHIVP